MCNTEPFFWIVWLILIIIIVVICCFPNYSYGPYANIICIFFWIFFFLFIVMIIDIAVACTNTKCVTKNDSCPDHTNYKVKFDTYCSKTNNIELHSMDLSSKQRQTIRFTINGTECVQDDNFNCDPTGFSEVVTIALPKNCDNLIGMNVNKPIELYSWTAPSGSIFTYSYVIPFGTSYVTVTSPPNIVATGELQFIAQNNIIFTDISTVS